MFLEEGNVYCVYLVFDGIVFYIIVINLGDVF